MLLTFAKVRYCFFKQRKYHVMEKMCCLIFLFLRFLTRIYIKTNSKPIKILVIFKTKFALCIATITSRVVLTNFQGRISLVVRVVPHQTSHFKMLAVMLMIKQILVFVTQKHTFPKARQGLIYKIRAASNINQKSLFFWKKGHQKFYLNLFNLSS